MLDSMPGNVTLTYVNGFPRFDAHIDRDLEGPADFQLGGDNTDLALAKFIEGRLQAGSNSVISIMCCLSTSGKSLGCSS